MIAVKRHRYHRQLARILDRQAAEVVHDRLPFLDLPDCAVPRHGINTGVIHRADRRQQVGRVTAERDDHFGLLCLAENLHHLFGGLDGIGELHRAGAIGVEQGFSAE